MSWGSSQLITAKLHLSTLTTWEMNSVPRLQRNQCIRFDGLKSKCVKIRAYVNACHGAFITPYSYMYSCGFSSTPLTSAAVLIAGLIVLLSTFTHYVFMLQNTLIQLKQSDWAAVAVYKAHMAVALPARFYPTAVWIFLLFTPPACQDSS